MEDKATLEEGGLRGQVLSERHVHPEPNWSSVRRRDQKGVSVTDRERIKTERQLRPGSRLKAAGREGTADMSHVQKQRANLR